jgi:hypothetical protein
MPRPAYIVCSVSGAVDQFNGSISCFGLIETVYIPNPESPPLPIPKPLFVRITIAWLKEDGDENRDYEGQVVVRLPDGQILRTADGDDIVLGGFVPIRIVTPVHRLLVPETGFPQLPGPGLVRVECRLRLTGTEAWTVSQSYPVLFLIAPPTPPPAAPESSAPSI